MFERGMVPIFDDREIPTIAAGRPGASRLGIGNRA